MPDDLWQQRFKSELEEPYVDPRFGYLLDCFYDLSRAREYTQSGYPMALKWHDIQAYSQLVYEMNSWQVETIVELDQVFIQCAGEVTKE